MVETLGVAAASGGLCLLAIIALRPVAVAVDLVDRPGGRKIHNGEIPVIGGIAMFLGAVLGIGLLPVPPASALAFLAACALLVTVGLIDDRFQLSPWTRLPAQVAAAILVMLASGKAVVTLGNPFGGGAIELHGYASYAFTVLVVLAAINAFNMLDGLDGIAGGVAIIALAALATIAESGRAVAICIVFIGVIAAFLVFNIPTRFNRGMRCFMGDAGSTLLGFVVAWVCIAVSQHPGGSVEPVTTLWVVAIPLYELVWSTARRLARGVSPFRADSRHFHHLLLKAGFGLRSAFVLMICLGGVLASIGIALNWVGAPDWVSLALFLLTGVGVVRLMYRADLLWGWLPSMLRHYPPLEPQPLPERLTA